MRLRQIAMIAMAAVFAACSSDDVDDDKTNGGDDENKTPQWHQVWVEDFEEPTLESSVWRRIPRGTSDWNNNMTTDDCVFEKRDGTIVLKGIERPANVDDQQQFLVGGIETRGLKKFEPPFRVEVRARLTAAQGAWPAIWMMPFAENAPWPDCGEIDIMERLNHDSRVYQSIHSSYYDTQHKDNPPHSTTAYINKDDWNVYGLAVTKDAVVWFVNGLETFRYSRLKPEVSGQFPFYVPQYLRIDMQLGGSWVGAVNPSELPVEMEVDWVKYYRYY